MIYIYIYICICICICICIYGQGKHTFPQSCASLSSAALAHRPCLAVATNGTCCDVLTSGVCRTHAHKMLTCLSSHTHMQNAPMCIATAARNSSTYTGKMSGMSTPLAFCAAVSGFATHGALLCGSRFAYPTFQVRSIHQFFLNLDGGSFTRN
jgi:hypothetical protein